MLPIWGWIPSNSKKSWWNGDCLKQHWVNPPLLSLWLKNKKKEGNGSEKLFDANAFDCFLVWPMFGFQLTSRRAEKDQRPQHLGLRPVLKAFRSSPQNDVSSGWQKQQIAFSLAAWWFQPLWKIFVSWDNYSQYMEKSNMFQTTNQLVFYMLFFLGGWLVDTLTFHD